MIEVSALTKRFNKHVAVDGVSFTVPKGEVLGFLGPNGAGKTTTMRMIVGSVYPTSGTVRIGGHDLLADTIAAQKLLGYLPENATTYGEMSVYEFLSFIADVRRLGGSERAKALDRVRELCFLDDVWHQMIETLSKGYRQRVGFAQALLHDPAVLILDEPTDGLDPNQKHEVRNLIRQMGTSKTIILSTHILEEVESVCSRVVIISQGKIATDSKPADLLKKSRYCNSVVLSVANKPKEEVEGTISKLPFVEKIETLENGSVRVFPKKQALIASEISQLASQNKWNVSEFAIDRGRLDDVFRTLTTVQKG
jgi:ABC-2 type transport system ATP-binding protein